MNKPVNANQEFQSDFLSVTEARNAISTLIQDIQLQAKRSDAMERLPLKQCLGRILANDILSPINVPANDNSAMDGFAFNSKELKTDREQIHLRIVGTVYAGQTSVPPTQASECIKIMTGAMMPPDCDTVIPQEFTQLSDEGSITFAKDTVRAGENRRLRGEDLQAGKPAIQQGRILKASDIGLAASLGIAELRVYQRIKVAILSSGDELCDMSEPLVPGKIYDSNRFSLHACLSRLGFEIMDCGIVRDTPEDLRRAFTLASQQADVIISSGGVSVGEADFTKQIMDELGEVGFWKIAMRPGRPMAFGSLKPISPKTSPTVFFGLPGNPVAVMVTFLAFVRPALLRLMGCTAAEPVLLRAHSGEALRKKPGRTEYQRGIVTRQADGALHVRTTGNQGSGVLRSMVEANGLIVLHHGQGNVAVGDAVDVMVIDGVI